MSRQCCTPAYVYKCEVVIADMLSKRGLARKDIVLFGGIGVAAVIVAMLYVIPLQTAAPQDTRPLRIVAESFSKVRVGEDAPFVSLAKAGVPPYQYEWNFGDGITSQIQNTTHIYNGVGNYTVTLTVTDSAGEVRDVSHRITVHPPDANFTRADDILRY
jgi:hypothetical protein